MKILIAAAECAPLAKTGGLADVVGTLPRHLIALGHDARVMIPYHRSIKDRYAGSVEHLLSFEVQLGWRRQYAGIERLSINGMTVYLVDNEFYFGGPIYKGGEYEGEQYAFFTAAMLEALPRLGFIPDVIHCNDWHTALTPMLLKTRYNCGELGSVKTLFTIHNIAYQGRFDFGFFRDVLDIDPKYNTTDYMVNDGCASFMKAGCVFADKINTVSPTYAREILSPGLSEGLDGILNYRRGDLCGILNGIDTVVFDPEHDPDIPFHYTAGDLSGKRRTKEALMQELGLHGDPDAPMVAMVTRMTGQKGFELVMQAIDEIMGWGIFFVLVGTGDWYYEGFMREAENRHKGRLCSFIGYSEELAHRVYAASDMFLMPSMFEPCGLSQMIAMRYGSVPVVRETGGLKDTVEPYNRYTGEGVGFTFRDITAGDMKNALGRGLELYHNDRAAFTGLIRAGMARDFSFARSAREYERLFLSLL